MRSPLVVLYYSVFASDKLLICMCKGSSKKCDILELFSLLSLLEKIISTGRLIG